MTLTARKIAAFSKLISALADHPNLGSTAILKQWFDSSPEELRTALNGLIDDLASTSSGVSGAEQVGSAPIGGVTGDNVYAQIASIKSQLTGILLSQIADGTLSIAKFDMNAQAGLIGGQYNAYINLGGF